MILHLNQFGFYKYGSRKSEQSAEETPAEIRAYGMWGADVVGMTGFHIEVKRVERLDLNAAMEQSIRDAAENEIPVVFHRRDRDYWKVTMRLDDFMNVLRKENADVDS